MRRRSLSTEHMLSIGCVMGSSAGTIERGRFVSTLLARRTVLAKWMICRDRYGIGFVGLVIPCNWVESCLSYPCAVARFL